MMKITQPFSVSQACIDFVAPVTYADLPTDVIDTMKRDTLDWIGCAIGGAYDPASQPIYALMGELGGKAQADTFGGPRLDPVRAAMVNGYCGHILEMDDVDRDSISHPATVNIPPALALAQATGKSGRDVILSAVCGFEVMLRVGAAVTPGHYQIFHTTATTGVFGAAMSAGKMLGLTPTQLMWALGNAGSTAAGLWQFLPDGGMSKFLHTAQAAGNGVTVAMLAARGFSGATRILEGEQGFFAGYARQDVKEELFKDFGTRWRSGTISFKPYPCCRHTHSAIDAADDIRRQAAGRELAEVRVLTYRTADQVAGIRAPVTGRQAKFSIAYCVASTLLDGTPSEASFSEEAVKREEVRALESRIEVVVSDEITACVPRNWPCRIEAVTTDGEHLTAQIFDPKGDPENMLSWDGVEVKFRLLTERGITQAAQDRIIALCKDLENLTDVGELFNSEGFCCRESVIAG